MSLCHGTNAIPSDRFSSNRNNPANSLDTGTPAEAKLRVTNSFRASVKPVTAVRDLGVYLDTDMSMTMQITYLASSCFGILRDTLLNMSIVTAFVVVGNTYYSVYLVQG